jgi:hypothetical protein
VIEIQMLRKRYDTAETEEGWRIGNNAEVGK